MSGIRGTNTKPELALRRALHARGFRFRLHSSEVYGRPDLILSKFRAVIFVHGCFWHRHEGCRFTTSPSTRPEFWLAKFVANVARDSVVRARLLQDGWRVATVWECALKKPSQVELSIKILAAWLRGNSSSLEICEINTVVDKYDVRGVLSGSSTDTAGVAPQGEDQNGP